MQTTYYSLFQLTIVKLIFEHSKQTKSSIKFGFNTAITLIENYDSSTPLFVFVFYNTSPNSKSNLSILLNFLILKTTNKTGVSLFLIDKTYQKDFLALFKLKKMLCFSLMQNEFNSKVIGEIQSLFSNYNSNSNCITPIYTNAIKETTIEK